VFPTIEGNRWAANRFRVRVWLRSVEAAVKNDRIKREDAPSVFEGCRFHMLRDMAASFDGALGDG
jgi:hypothetical protein